MALFSWLLRILLVGAGALLGNYVGEFVRNPRVAADGTPMGLVRTPVAGGSVIGIRLNPTNFLPAVVFAYFAGPPRMIAAFLAGVLASALLGDRFEPESATTPTQL